jgi:hypothetical protein
MPPDTAVITSGQSDGTRAGERVRRRAPRGVRRG